MCLSISVEMGGKVDVGIDKTRHDRHSGQVIGDRAPEPVDPGEAAKQRGNEAMKSEKYNQAVSHCESDRPLGRADTGTDRHCADRHRGAADGADQPRLLLEPQVRPRPRHL